MIFSASGRRDDWVVRPNEFGSKNRSKGSIRGGTVHLTCGRGIGIFFAGDGHVSTAAVEVSNNMFGKQKRIAHADSVFLGACLGLAPLDDVFIVFLEALLFAQSAGMQLISKCKSMDEWMD